MDAHCAVETWRTDGWVLCDGLVDRETIDAAAADLAAVFPTAEQYHADPEGERRRWLGTPPPSREPFVWPPGLPGPAASSERHRFPFARFAGIAVVAGHASCGIQWATFGECRWSTKQTIILWA